MATATFDDILAAQRETNQILGKQKSPLDGRTGAGKALLEAQRETTFALDGISDSDTASVSQQEESEKDKAPWVNSNKITEDISCDVFRSLCPVTGQPDWATIRINYSGKHINYRKLLKYLLSYRNMQAFHEECVEKIFVDINAFCEPDDLTVTANYMRRGGIELNPLRSSIKEFNKEILREIKQ